MFCVINDTVNYFKTVFLSLRVDFKETKMAMENTFNRNSGIEAWILLT